MRLTFGVALIIGFLLVGCGRGSSRMVVDDPVQDALDGLGQSVSEAFESIRLSTQPAMEQLGDEMPEMTAPIPAALGAVVAAAQDVVNASVGKPNEPGAKALLAAAQELESASKSGAPAAAIEQGLQQLRTKVNDLKQKR